MTVRRLAAVARPPSDEQHSETGGNYVQHHGVYFMSENEYAANFWGRTLMAAAYGGRSAYIIYVNASVLMT